MPRHKTKTDSTSDAQGIKIDLYDSESPATVEIHYFDGTQLYVNIDKSRVEEFFTKYADAITSGEPAVHFGDRSNTILIRLQNIRFEVFPLPYIVEEKDEDKNSNHGKTK